MPRFSYKAATPGGEVIEGVIDATNRQAVIDRLRGQGHVPIRAEEMAGGFRLSFSLKPRRMGPKELSLKTRELATLLHAGLPLDRSLTILRDLAGQGPARVMIERVQEQVRGGATLADALEVHPDVFPGFYIGMIRAGEAGGNLEGVLSALADSLERSQRLRESVKSALQYPVIVVIMAVISLGVLMTAVVPEFQPLFEDAGAALPMITRVVIGASDFLAQYWWALVFVLLLLVLAIRHHNRDPKGRLRWDSFMLRVVVLGDLMLKIETARFARTLGTLSKNGVSLLNAMTMTIGTVENRAIAEALGEVKGLLAKGEGLSRPLTAAGIFPTLALQLIQVGEESGSLDDMLLKVAEIYDDEVQRSLQRLLALLTPLITVVLGVLIAVIIGSMVSAILSSYNLPF